MATKKTGRQSRKDSQIIVRYTDIRQANRTFTDIKTWRDALKAAENTTNPTRYNLYDLYNEAMLDGHLKSVINKRITAIINAPLHFSRDGDEVDEIMDSVNTEDFDYILKELLNSRFWGYTLLEMDLTDGISAALVDRRHVKPEKNLVVKQPYDTTGIDYTQPPYAGTVLAAGDVKDFGLMLQACQYVIYKRGGIGDWAQFAELFGMPLKVGKYDGYDELARKKLVTDLDSAGSAATMVIPKDTDIEFVESKSSGNNNVYKEFVETLNAEISKLIVGQTLTTEQGQRGARSLGEVHAEVEEQIFEADKRFVEHILNEKLIPLMEAAGMQVKGGMFMFGDAELDIKTRLDIDMQLKNGGLLIDDDYLYNKYGIPKPDNYDEMKEEERQRKEDAAEAFKKTGEKKKNEKDKDEGLSYPTEPDIWKRIQNFFS